MAVWFLIKVSYRAWMEQPALNCTKETVRKQKIASGQLFILLLSWN